VRFSVEHDSEYSYDVPVTLGRHVLRLTPRARETRNLTQSLLVTPEPVSRRQYEDAHGNTLTELSFVGETQTLQVQSVLDVETVCPPALRDEFGALPWVSSATGNAVDETVRQFAQEVAKHTRHHTLAFLDELCRAIYERTYRHLRLTGDARSAEQTLSMGSGACRDVVILFLETCRAVGLNARFVSGYQAHAATLTEQRQLHAWAEVELPNYGYRGWDPTHGARVEQDHVPLCSAPTQAETMPIEGGFTFAGPTVNSTLKYSVSISTA
jgi:transglutaminase-like putative cysteine protease